ncbi:MAG: macromolecule metabolism [Gammaproteobacteria bacterium]|nr:macromolecule metabolism [Gammaproteobacteria bacterium]
MLMTRYRPYSAPPITRRAMLKGSVATLLAGNSLRGAPAGAEELRVGTRAPAVTLVTVDGARISSADLLGSVVVLTFWATWCAPCRDELPLLSRYAAQHAAAGLRVLGFSLDTPDELPEVRKIAQSLRFPVGLLCHSSAPGYGRIWRLPVNFTIDRAGLLVEDGWQERKPSWTAERLEEVVTPLLEPRSSRGGA